MISSLIQVHFRHVITALMGVATILCIVGYILLIKKNWGTKIWKLAKIILTEEEDSDAMNDEVINGRIDFFEIPSGYRYNIDMPGVRDDEVSIDVEDNGRILVISGKRRVENATERSNLMNESNTAADVPNGKYIKRERKMGRFLKMFLLPENADPNNIVASTQDGVLVVKVEKLPYAMVSQL